jgi:alpha-amylase
MKKVSFNIEIHQPLKLQTYRFFEIMASHYYYDDLQNDYNIRQAVENFYIPVNETLLDLIYYSDGAFKSSFLFSGVVLNQFQLYIPEIIENYRNLISTGSINLLQGNYSNSFGAISGENLNQNQLLLQKEKVKSIFGKVPEPYPSRNQIYTVSGMPELRIYSENKIYREEVSLNSISPNTCALYNSTERLINMMASDKGTNTIVEIFIPYNSTYACDGKNKKFLEFLKSFPLEVLTKTDFTFAFPFELGNYFQTSLRERSGSVNHLTNKELLYSSFNEMQIDAFERLNSLNDHISLCGDAMINKDWQYLQSRDHFYFMDPSLYEEEKFNRSYLPYDSDYFAYINYMNILMDLSFRLDSWFNINPQPKGKRKNQLTKIS